MSPEESARERERRAAKLLRRRRGRRIIEKLKGRGLTSPYLRPFVVARINPIRFSTSTEFDFDDVLDRMQSAAAKFNVEKIKQEDVVRAGGAPEEEEGPRCRSIISPATWTNRTSSALFRVGDPVDDVARAVHHRARSNLGRLAGADDSPVPDATIDELFFGC